MALFLSPTSYQPLVLLHVAVEVYALRQGNVLALQVSPDSHVNLVLQDSLALLVLLVLLTAKLVTTA